MILKQYFLLTSVLIILPTFAMGSCFEEICVGEKVYLEYGVEQYKIIGISSASDTPFLLKDRNGKVQKESLEKVYTLSGCLREEYCVGRKKYLTPLSPTNELQIVGISKKSTRLKFIFEEETDVYQPNQLFLKQGCVYDLCVGSFIYYLLQKNDRERYISAEVYAVAKVPIEQMTSERAYIISFKENGEVLYEFLDIGGWFSSEFYLKRGCHEHQDYCIGDEYYKAGRDALQNIVGIPFHVNSKVLLEDKNDKQRTAIYFNNLYKLKGCMKKLCVGDKVRIKHFDTDATIIGISTSSSFPIKVRYNNGSTEEWEASDLEK